MHNQNHTDYRIMEVSIRSPHCELEEVVLQCEGQTWNQVFLAIDRLSRSDELQLRYKRPGVYTVCMPERIVVSS